MFVADQASQLEPGLADWMQFLRDHAAGLNLFGVPNIPTCLLNNIAMSSDSAEVQSFTFDAPAYDSTSITPEVARRIQTFYLTNGFLPPPRHPLEHLRAGIIHDYDLHSPEQVRNIQSALNVLQAYYGGVAAFTLFDKNIQSLSAVSGSPSLLKALDLHPGKRIIPETSLCGHASLSTGSAFVPDFLHDWRFQRNPFTGGAVDSAAKDYINTQESLSAYLGIPVTLRLDPASTTETATVPIGVINVLITDSAFAARPISSGQTMVLEELTQMLQTQLRTTWDGNRRSLDTRARRTISDFIERTLARPCLERITNDVQGRGEQTDNLTEFAELACTQICGVLSEAETAMIIDLRVSGSAVSPSASLACISQSDVAELSG